jgi:hypothetical protein
VTIVNLSGKKLYIGVASYGDSSAIMQDTRLYCSENHHDNTYIPQIVNNGDSLVTRTKLSSIETIDVLDVDSLEEYCRKGISDDITRKSWVRLLSEKVDMENETCRFVIK